MKKRLLTTREMIFLISTRAALAAGIALLVSPRLNQPARWRSLRERRRLAG